MSDSEIFLAESLGSAIIDTACTRTVGGEKWLENYVKDLSSDQVNQVLQTEIPSCRTFRFGANQTFRFGVNQTLTKIIQKMKLENGFDWHTALDWALMAKNSIFSVHGYSPHQLVLGQNPNLPSILVDKLPV